MRKCTVRRKAKISHISNSTTLNTIPKPIVSTVNLSITTTYGSPKSGRYRQVVVVDEWAFYILALNRLAHVLLCNLNPSLTGRKVVRPKSGPLQTAFLEVKKFPAYQKVARAHTGTLHDVCRPINDKVRE